jgi:predicted acyl esterase
LRSISRRVFLPGLLLAAAWAGGAHSQTRQDVSIAISGGDTLDALSYTPPQHKPPHGFPALVDVPGFGLTKLTEAATCSVYARMGYVTLTYSVRGQGNSTGLSTIMSRKERQDLGEVINYVKGVRTVDPGAIGVMGGSQGGLHALWAAADRLSVKAVSADDIIPGWASDMFMNGCVRRTALQLLQTGPVRYAPVRDTLWQLARRDSYDSLKTLFARDRDVDTTQLALTSVPVESFVKWQDHYFSAGGGIDAYLRSRGTATLYAGTGGHYSDVSPAESNFQDDHTTRWFGYFVMGQSTGILGDPPLTYAYSSLPMDSLGYFQWQHENGSTWPPAGIRRFKFYLSPDSVLSYFPPSIGSDSLILANEYLDSSYTFDMGFVEGFHGPRFDHILPRTSLAFTTPPLSADLMWVGAPSMSLFVRSDHVKFPVHVQIYEVDELGAKYFINRINYIARGWEPGSTGVIAAIGIPHAHKFMQGHRIRVEITNMDKTNRLVLGSYPFVAPVFAQTSVTLFADASHPSFIEIPLAGSLTSLASTDHGVPTSYRLLQNYPNPFNPSTTISLSVPRESDVTLRIFDALGRTVATLIDGRLSSGNYSVAWNAAVSPGPQVSPASGVYFYRMAARPVGSAAPAAEITRSMILIR